MIMNSITNFSIKSAFANARRIRFVLISAATLFVASSLLSSCGGNLKGNAGNGDNGNNATEQQAAEPVKSENGNTKEDVIAELEPKR